jgi:hypothetical protein
VEALNTELNQSLLLKNFSLQLQNSLDQLQEPPQQQQFPLPK